MAAVHGDPYGHLVGLVDLFGEQVEHGGVHVGQAHRGVGAGQFDGVLPVLVADDEEPAGEGQRAPVGQAPADLGGVGGAAAQVGGEDVGELGQAGRDPPGGDGAVLFLRVEDVREPLGPLPVRGEPVAGDAEGDGDVVGGVQDGGVHEQGAGDAQDAFAVADDADVPGPVEGDGQREVAGAGEAGHEGAGLVEHEPVGRGEDPARALSEGERLDGDVTGAQARAQEVGVGAAAFPQPRGVAYEVVEGLRRRVEAAGLLTECLLAGAERLALLLQVLQVALALGAAGALGLAALGPEQGDGADQREDQHDRADGGELAVADDGHHHDRAHHAGHRQERGGRAADLALGQVGRRLDGVGFGGGGGHGAPGGPVDELLGHRAAPAAGSARARWSTSAASRTEACRVSAPRSSVRTAPPEARWRS